MPIVKTLRCGLKYFYGVLLALYITAPAYAFAPSQVPLLSAPAVPPNLMLLVDNSGSMNNIIWASGFDPVLVRPKITYSYKYYICGRNYCDGDRDILGDDTMILSQASSNGCGSGYYYVKRDNVAYCFVLPDPVDDANEGSTRFTADYLSYLVDLSRAAGVTRKDFTKGSIIPSDFRMNVARSVAKDLVVNTTKIQGNTSIRIGLANFNPPTNDDSGPGGKIAVDVKDLAEVKKTTYQAAVSATTAAQNVTDLTTAIGKLRSDSNTPLAETYYEVTRYFRGMKPYYNSTPAQYTSPIQYRCQKNFSVVVTDGLPTYDRTFPKDDPDDLLNKDRSLPDWDLNSANDGANVNGDGEGDRLYLDDIAKFAYDIDMRKPADGTDLALKNWDTAGFNPQNMVTYTVGFTAANQMLIDAADTNHGHGTYFQTNDGAGLTNSLASALRDINAKAGSGGGGATNSATLVTGTQFYQTLYDPADWRGTIKAYNIDTATGSTTTFAWNTDDTITSAAPKYESFNTATSKTIPLVMTRFSTDQQAVLNSAVTSSQRTQYGIVGSDFIAWAMGTNKTGLRQRTKLLGDIVNSPLASALPTSRTASDLADDATYTNYLNAKMSNMSYSLLVNANDGFMHVINPVDGTRRYAYMPSTVLPSLVTLSALDYGGGSHKFTVDGPLSVMDVKPSSSAPWQTVAFGGTGAGGKAYYAVNLYTAGSNDISALWEVQAPASADILNTFNDLGFAYSKPDVANMADGTGIVAIGNGYGSNTGLAALYILNATTGALISKIAIPAKSGESDNGLSSVKLLTDSKNVVQAAYAGDLRGRLWKFDLSSTTALGWKVAYGTASNPLPLFTAPRGVAQPITVQPVLVDHPNKTGKMVYFGTGKFLEAADKTTTDQQAFYAVWDNGVGNLAEANLVAQAINGTVVAGAGTSNGNTYFTSTNNDVDWASKKGWYLPLATSSPYLGERIIYPAQTSRGRIIFTTAAVSSGDPCESTGTGRIFELDAAKGGMLTYQVLDTNGDNDVSNSDSIVSGLAFNTGIPNLAAIVAGISPGNDNKYIIDSSGGGVTKLLEKGGTSNVYQRIMWRQIQ